MFDKKKYYAVRIGKVPGIYNTWAECKTQVAGFSKAEYKSFKTLKEAEEFLISEKNTSIKKDTKSDIILLNKQIEEEISDLKVGEAIAFVDGTYSREEEKIKDEIKVIEKVGFGAVIFTRGKKRKELYKSYTDEELVQYRNVSGELEGSKESIIWAVGNGIKKIKIFYDYAGIEKWATGEWRANNDVTKKYVDFIKEHSDKIKIEFMKVPAHLGVKYNEEADLLAKKSLLKDEGKVL